MLAGVGVTLPVALLLEGAPTGEPGVTGPIVAAALLASVGSLLPFTLYAYAQVRVAPAVAASFLNLEPLVGAAAGALAFGDPFAGRQAAGVLLVLAGVALVSELRGPARRPLRSRGVLAARGDAGSASSARGRAAGRSGCELEAVRVADY
jgi:drug/metabolite transporter (DMT)-like permease